MTHKLFKSIEQYICQTKAVIRRFGMSQMIRRILKFSKQYYFRIKPVQIS